MGVGSARHPELERVGAEVLFHLQAVLERFADVFVLQSSPGFFGVWVRLPRSQSSYAAKSSVGDSDGCDSLCPFI